MSVQVTFTFPSAADAAAFLTKHNAPAPATAAEAADRLFGQHNKPAVVDAATAPAPAATAPAPAARAPAPAAPERTFDYDKDVLPALVALSTVMDRSNFAGTLARYGCSKVPELKAKPEAWKEITEYAEEFVKNAGKSA
jgi:hypothetical protein